MGRGLLRVLLLAWVAGSAAGQDTLPVPPPGGWFWQARPYSEWTPAELIQFFTESPWSRPATLVEPGMQVTLGGPRYFVHWYSAQTMREALVRRGQLHGQGDPNAAAEFLAAPHVAYELYLFAGFMTDQGSLRIAPLDLMKGLSAQEIQQGARLQFSGQDYSSRPDRVEFVQDANSGQLRGLVFTFERARAAVPPERASGGLVRFTCATPHGKLSVSFVLNDMRRGGAPDL
jgi:hypothetical protein